MSDEHGSELEAAVTVRLPSELLERIDRLVRARPTKIPRHSWLLEAIHEKLGKEDRVEGVLDIFWENNSESNVAATYRLRFLTLARRPGGPVAPLTVVGDDCLERYLVRWGFSAANADGWVQRLKKQFSVSIPNVMLPADLVGPYGFKVGGLGIQTRLPDGRIAILYHDHPKNAPAEVRGDQIKLCGLAGIVEREATITTDGRVLILVEKHISPPHAPDTIQIKFREATAGEREEFLSIHRFYVPD
jgi:hypothetical protein